MFLPSFFPGLVLSVAKYLALENTTTWFSRFSLLWLSKDFCNSEAKFDLMNDTSSMSKGNICVE